MGLPGHRRTSSDKRRRSAHFALTEVNAQKCPKCGTAILPHRVCAFCGTYKGRQVIDVSKRDVRGKRRAKKNK
ncbi:50S ribosomal protein L32 [Patescibacteria group bacterium]|nr:MAG: 50S ribosomal protein L32 [Patescibacteria group bacterium]